jgi:hypothetical protein
MRRANSRLGATRRALLMLAIAAPAAGYAAGARAAGACVDLDALPSSQKSMRASLGFRVASEDPQRHCSGCAFFTAADAGCGKCALLSGGPVPADGRCDSWAARK